MNAVEKYDDAKKYLAVVALDMAELPEYPLHICSHVDEVKQHCDKDDQCDDERFNPCLGLGFQRLTADYLSALRGLWPDRARYFPYA